ncbi:gluconate 2-dehydrogenase subunit 3 family protein [Fodinisporobacter ferrooxydans]|uniref:Gluconate 2-dehydrogenase subunit 3 family protein n=1 Tax=Fodinisporobacter ferrooxydans TaxID=2901836 RepID=A0ABY4CTU7_9BACL|nr:gluconate 2-dehydrogenase subunit 3 family protein [Alicyclobacillaceae bacterium MYW30-H2]
MPVKEGYYTKFDVMQSLPEWDSHTREIVQQRLHGSDTYANLTIIEAEILKSLCQHMTGEERPDVIQYAVTHLDQQSAAAKGESQRKAGTPPLGKLIANGLQAFELSVRGECIVSFLELEAGKQLEIVQKIRQGHYDRHSCWLERNISPNVWFQKLLGIFTEAVYSHPVVWSEIGYAGPAYPRGYVRVGLHDIDPWEAIMDV